MCQSENITCRSPVTSDVYVNQERKTTGTSLSLSLSLSRSRFLSLWTLYHAINFRSPRHDDLSLRYCTNRWTYIDRARAVVTRLFFLRIIEAYASSSCTLSITVYLVNWFISLRNCRLDLKFSWFMKAASETIWVITRILISKFPKKFCPRHVTRWY